MAKYTTEFHNLLVNMPVTSDESKPMYDENGKAIGSGSINFRVRCMGEADNAHKPANYEKYPIWKEEYRKELNDKIIHHFYYREIGCETIAQFCDRFLWTMEEIMPKYNKMFRLQETLLLDDGSSDPAKRSYSYLLGKKEDWEERHTGTDKTEFGRTSTRTGDAWTEAGQSQKTVLEDGTIKEDWDASVGTDTRSSNAACDNENPESNIDINLGVQGQIPAQQYATRTDFSNNHQNITGGNRTHYNGVEDKEGGDNKLTHGHNISRKGYKDIDAIDVLERFPDAYMDIYQMIFKDLEPLFMGIF